MKRMKLGWWSVSLMLGLFVLVAWPGASWAKAKKADQGDDGAVKIQTDVANEDAPAKDDEKTTEDKPAAKGEDKSEKKKTATEVDDAQAQPSGENQAGDGDDLDMEDGEKDKDELEINPELAGDFAQMARVGKLDEQQQLALLQAQQDMELALQKWDDKWDEKIGKAEDMLAETSNSRKRANLNNWIKAKRRQRKKLSSGLFSKALKALKPEQLAAWNSAKLWEMVEIEFTDLNLTDSQVGKIQADCDKLAKRIKGTKDISGNKKLRQLILKRAYARLSKRQKFEYRKIKAEEKRLEKEARKKEREDKRKHR